MKLLIHFVRVIILRAKARKLCVASASPKQKASHDATSLLSVRFEEKGNEPLEMTVHQKGWGGVD